MGTGSDGAAAAPAAAGQEMDGGEEGSPAEGSLQQQQQQEEQEEAAAPIVSSDGDGDGNAPLEEGEGEGNGVAAAEAEGSTTSELPDSGSDSGSEAAAEYDMLRLSHPSLPPSLSAKLLAPAFMDMEDPYHDHSGSHGELSPRISFGGGGGGGGGGTGERLHHRHPPPLLPPLSVSFGPGVPSDSTATYPYIGQRHESSTPPSLILRTVSSLFQPPSASARLRMFILFAITWSATMTTCLGPFFPIYMKDRFHASAMLIGLVFSVTSFSQFLACPVVAPFAHQFSRVAALKTGLMVLFAGGLIFGVLDQPAGFIFGRILQGIGNGFVEVAGLSLLMSYSKDLKRDVGWMEGASSVGFLIGPMLGGFLSSNLGFRTLFLIMSLPNAGLVAILIFAPGAVLPRGGDPTLVDASQHSIGQSQHSVNHSVHSVATISSLNSGGGKGSVRSGGGGGAGGSGGNGNGGSGERGGERVTTASRRRRKAATLKRTGQALLSSPTLPLYVLIVLVVAGALGFMDTTLAEHLAAALGASTFTAGLLFTIQITVYVLSSFCAGQIAHKVGRWRAVLVSTLLWSGGMFALGPIPGLPRLYNQESRRVTTTLIVTTLGVLGCLEAFIFLPFIPCLHHRFRTRLRWRGRETEDAVAAIWTTVFAMGQSLGPIVGGYLMETLPKTREVGCKSVDETECYSAFPWASAAFGIAGFACSGLLALALARRAISRCLCPSLATATTAASLPFAPPAWFRVFSHPNGASASAVPSSGEQGVVSVEQEELAGALPVVGVQPGSVESSLHAHTTEGFGSYENALEEEEEGDDDEWDDLNCSRHGSVLPGLLVFSMSRQMVESDERERRAQIDASTHSMLSMRSAHSAMSGGSGGGGVYGINIISPRSAPVQMSHLRPGSSAPVSGVGGSSRQSSGQSQGSRMQSGQGQGRGLD